MVDKLLENPYLLKSTLLKWQYLVSAGFQSHTTKWYLLSFHAGSRITSRANEIVRRRIQLRAPAVNLFTIQMQISYRNMESDHREESDSSSVEFEDHFNISLLPDKNRYRKKRFQGPNFVLKLREMFGGKTTIYGVVTTLLLVSVLLLLVLARPSSSHETVNSDSRKISEHDFGQERDAASGKKEVNAKESKSLRLPRHISPIEYLVYLHPNLTTLHFSGKVDVLLYCNEAASNITLHVGNNISYFNVAVGEVPDLNKPESIVPIEVTGISRLHGEMMFITLGSELQRDKFYFLIIEFNSELSKGLSGFYVSTYTTASGEKR